ncbi:Uncharacterised protein [Zhongshania aliphaticivorans]|uniref:Uncharacterized protein n=1 Tax=Zhongshania aliphaticivorans TaxID=1470434 RepID=A0A5S9MSZ8_9GAMM|nr:Uncharacterised protein [Zhongshania aliphaticivorans]CAA0085909.1 Uncharacterised protein [Zhongshania aliphaticivorans]
MDRWISYLYEQHSENELKNWASRLKYFRYFRAYGGHANDVDSLDIALKYETSESLLNIFGKLGIEPTIYLKKPEQPIPGKRYSLGEYNAFPCLIPATEWIKQPSHCVIFGVNVHVWCESDLIKVSASPSSYIVTAEHVESAEKLERHLGELKNNLIDPPRDTKHYICPRYHPNIFS